MSASRSRVEARDAPKAVAVPCLRAITPSTRSKTPPTRIPMAPQPKRPIANATPAATETAVPATVIAFGLIARRNRKGSAASTQAARRSPKRALITSRAARRGGRLARGLRRRGLAFHVGQLGESALELGLGDPAAALHEAAVEAELAQGVVQHQSVSRPGDVVGRSGLARRGGRSR